MTDLRTLVAALGSGLAMAIFWFPITYLAMRKQYQFRGKLLGASRQFCSCVVLLALTKLFGPESSTSTSLGLIAFWVAPMCICALVLYTTYRSAEAPSPKQRD